MNHQLRRQNRPPQYIAVPSIKLTPNPPTQNTETNSPPAAKEPTMPTTPAQPSETQLPAAQHETEQPNTSPEPQPQPQAQPKAAHPLRSRNFILLVAGQGISLFGNMMLRFAMSMWVLDETGSATAFRIHPRHIVRADDPRRPVRRRVGRPDEPPHAHGHPRRGIRRDGRARARLVLRRRIQHHRRGRNAGGAIAARYLRDADRRIRAAADAAPIRGMRR